MPPKKGRKKADEEPPPPPIVLSFKNKSWKKGKALRNLKQIIPNENYHLYPVSVATYINIQAPPSMYPKKKYCDITGFEAKYRERATGLQYYGPAEYQTIKELPESKVQELKALRGALQKLK